MMQLQLEWRPFLGQVAFPPFEESRSQKVVRLNKALDDAVGIYSSIRFDQATLERLSAKVNNCGALIGRMLTEPDVAGAESAANTCLEDLKRALKEAGDAYYAASKAAASEGLTTEMVILGVLGAASVGVSAYHGYKRNNSTGWAIWWGFMGALFPVITPAIAIAQGFGKRERK